MGSVSAGLAAAVNAASPSELATLISGVSAENRARVDRALPSLTLSPAASESTLRGAGGNFYITYHYLYNRKLPLERIAAAGREVLQKFPSLQAKPSEGGELQELFSVIDSSQEEEQQGPRVVDPAKPFWAILVEGEEKSKISMTISHQEADACSIGMFVQAWASHYAGQKLPEPTFNWESAEAALDPNAPVEFPKHSGYMSQADLKPEGPPTLGVGVFIDLTQDKLKPYREALIAGGDAKDSFSLNTLRMTIIWKAFVEARKLDKDEATSLCWAINVRRRIPISGEYFGNAAITSKRTPLRVEEVSNMTIQELAQVLHKAVKESVTSESLLSVISNLKASMAAKGPAIPSQRASLFGDEHSLLLYSDWSCFDLNPSFDGGKAETMQHMIAEGKPCPIGIAVNQPEGLYIGVKPEEVEDFKAAANKLLDAVP